MHEMCRYNNYNIILGVIKSSANKIIIIERLWCELSFQGKQPKNEIWNMQNEVFASTKVE